MRGNPKQSSQDSQMHKQVEITLAEILLVPRTADFSHRYGMNFVLNNEHGRSFRGS
jgi:hypothetical protein